MPGVRGMNRPQSTCNSRAGYDE